MSRRPLVGERVRVARPVGGGPVNHEGHSGKVVDVIEQGNAFLVRFRGDVERWVPAANVTVVEAEVHDDLHARHEHEHLDAIEVAEARIARRRLAEQAKANRTRELLPAIEPYTAKPERVTRNGDLVPTLYVRGTVAAGRVALVGKSS